jgi:hypothetical protein
MNRIDTRNIRLNDVFFGVVLGTAVACSGWVAMVGAHAAEPAVSTAAAAPVQLERVVIIGHRESAPLAMATPVELPRVGTTGKRPDNAAIAQVNSRRSDV